MTNLLWPGDHRGGPLLTDAAVCRAMVQVEDAWLRALVKYSLIPAESADFELASLIEDSDIEQISHESDLGGNPVIPLVELLRSRAALPAQKWIHRGLTSQDVLDSALMLGLRDSRSQLLRELATQMRRLTELARHHSKTAMTARTLTRPAVETTFGMKAATWINSLCDATEGLLRLRFPIQIGGAAGTLAAPTQMATQSGGPEKAIHIALALVDYTADALDLDHSRPWHTSRAPITSIGDGFVGCTDAWGRIASDVLTLNRTEIAELAERTESGRGGSSTMPDKSNPVLSVLLRRTAITNPLLAATLHTAAALNNDERADGAWHAEWDTVRTLARRTLVAASHTTEMLAGLHVDAQRMAANLAALDVSGEQRLMASLIDEPETPTYLGATEVLIEEACDRAGLLIEDASRA